MTWIKASEKSPQLRGFGYEKTSDIVEVQFSNGRTGLGYVFDNFSRSGWRTKYEEDYAYYDKSWGDISVVAWRPQQQPVEEQP